MEGREGIKNFYRTAVVNNMLGLEEERKFIVKKIIWEKLLPTAILLIISLIFILIQNLGFKLMVGILCLVCFYYWWFYDSILSGQVKQFKYSIVKENGHFIDQDLKYDLKGKIPKEEVKKSKIITGKIDKYTGEGYVEGKIDEVQLKFSKITAKDKVKKRVRKVKWDTLFEGIFLIASFGKKFNSKVMIKTDILGKVFEHLNQPMQQSAGKIDNPFETGKIIRLSSSDFDKAFKVIATNKSGARNILTKDLMKEILHLKKEIIRHKDVFPYLKKNKIIEEEMYLSFIDTKLYVAIPFKGKNVFNPRLFSAYKEKFKDVKYYFDILRAAINIIKVIKRKNNNIY